MRRAEAKPGIREQGKLVLERYAKDKGIDRETPLASNSVCKSFANAFLGLRVADRAIKLTDLVQAPGWDNAEVLRRNMTSAPLAPALTCRAAWKS